MRIAQSAKFDKMVNNERYTYCRRNAPRCVRRFAVGPLRILRSAEGVETLLHRHNAPVRVRRLGK